MKVHFAFLFGLALATTLQPASDFTPKGKLLDAARFEKALQLYLFTLGKSEQPSSLFPHDHPTDEEIDELLDDFAATVHAAEPLILRCFTEPGYELEEGEMKRVVQMMATAALTHFDVLQDQIEVQQDQIKVHQEPTEDVIQDTGKPEFEDYSDVILHIHVFFPLIVLFLLHALAASSQS